jgi:hypothetical protein
MGRHQRGYEQKFEKGGLAGVEPKEMKRALGFVLLVVFAAIAPVVAAEDSADSAIAVETLRLQLLDVQAKETELQARERQLDEDLKPENIERALAGIGSTKPEDLRETRRRQLSIERDGVRTQLKIVATSRERLESVIRTAEAQAYQDSGSPLLNQAQVGTHSWSFAWLIGTLALGAEILGLGALVILALRRVRA